jgi:tetratricopeptide (TPR) repeat protein
MSDPNTPRQLLEQGSEAQIEAGFRAGDLDRSRQLLQEARAHAALDGDAVTEAAALDRLGMNLHYQLIGHLMAGEPVDEGDVDAEEALFQQALSMRQAIGEPGPIAESLFGVAIVHHVVRRDWDRAMPYLRQALEIVEAQPDRVDLYTRSEVYRHMGFYYGIVAGQPAEAVRYLQRSLDLREELGDPRRIPSGMVALAEAEMADRNATRAVELLRQAVAAAREVGLSPARIADAEETLRRAEAAQGAGG